MRVPDLGLDFAAPTSKGHRAAHRHMGSCRPERLWLWPWARECLTQAGRPCRGVNPLRVSPVPSVLPSACELPLPEAVTSTGPRAPAQLWRLRGEARPGAGRRADARAGCTVSAFRVPAAGPRAASGSGARSANPERAVSAAVQPRRPAPACCRRTEMRWALSTSTAASPPGPTRQGVVWPSACPPGPQKRADPSF